MLEHGYIETLKMRINNTTVDSTVAEVKAGLAAARAYTLLLEARAKKSRETALVVGLLEIPILLLAYWM